MSAVHPSAHPAVVAPLVGTARRAANMPAHSDIESRAADASHPVLMRVQGLRKAFGGLIATHDVDLEIRPGEIHALLGPNGAGKTTLLAQLTGELRPDAGVIHFEGRDVTRLPMHRRARLGIGRSFQITSIFPDLTVRENVALAVQIHAGHSFRFWKPVCSDDSVNGPAMRLLEKVGLADRADEPASQLGHGQHRQLEIGLALAGAPKLLLLDEPMAGMGREDSTRVVELLASLKGSVAMLLVEHDMQAVFSLADRLSVLVYGRRIATGTPAEIRANAEVRRAYLGEGD
ncbi:MAG: transporter ATP-binding protein [Rhizobacter sp.]|nr:transporter ATP-binding protein [Rhizobacter sp.]